MAKSTTQQSEKAKEEPKRSRVKQADVPKHSLREALSLAQAITDNFASHPTAPHQVAMAMGISPTSSGWRTLTGAASAYGLTIGGYGSEKISLTSAGLRCTAPTEEGDDLKARAEAALKPTIFSQFFTKYQRAKFPTDTIAKNVLQQEFGVPSDRTSEVLDTLKDNGAYVGFLHNTKTGLFVSTEDLSPSPVVKPHEEVESNEDDGQESTSIENEEITGKTNKVEIVKAIPFRIFISHGKNLKLLDQVKDVLDLYDIEYEIAIEEETTAIPVPQKVLTSMRRCTAGLMIVSSDNDEQQDSSINNNVLIEIGAAFVLYDQRVVLLWDKQLKVPTNLQGLYRCEFEGSELSFSVGTKLAKAMKGFRG